MDRLSSASPISCRSNRVRSPNTVKHTVVFIDTAICSADQGDCCRGNELSIGSGASRVEGNEKAIDDEENYFEYYGYEPIHYSFTHGDDSNSVPRCQSSNPVSANDLSSTAVPSAQDLIEAVASASPEPPPATIMSFSSTTIDDSSSPTSQEQLAAANDLSDNSNNNNNSNNNSETRPSVKRTYSRRNGAGHSVLLKSAVLTAMDEAAAVRGTAAFSITTTTTETPMDAHPSLPEALNASSSTQLNTNYQHQHQHQHQQRRPPQSSSSYRQCASISACAAAAAVLLAETDRMLEFDLNKKYQQDHPHLGCHSHQHHLSHKCNKNSSCMEAITTSPAASSSSSSSSCYSLSGGGSCSGGRGDSSLASSWCSSSSQQQQQRRKRMRRYSAKATAAAAAAQLRPRAGSCSSADSSTVGGGSSYYSSYNDEEDMIALASTIFGGLTVTTSTTGIVSGGIALSDGEGWDEEDDEDEDEEDDDEEINDHDDDEDEDENKVERSPHSPRARRQPPPPQQVLQPRRVSRRVSYGSAATSRISELSDQDIDEFC